jgi:hypothetical protein
MHHEIMKILLEAIILNLESRGSWSFHYGFFFFVIIKSAHEHFGI